MKKIAILSLHLGYGGIEKCVVNLANILCDKYEVEIACTYKLYEKPAFDLDKRVKVNYLGCEAPNKKELKDAIKHFKIFKIFKEGFKSICILHQRRKTMVNFIKNSDAEVIISTRDIFNSWLGDYAKDGVLKIGWEHNHYHNNYKYARSVVGSSYYLDYFVLVSESLRNFYAEALRRSDCKCVYIPNMIDEIPDKVSKLVDKKIVSIGRLSKEKAPLDLLKVFSILHTNYKDWKLEIIGDGVLKEEMEDFIQLHHLEDSVHLAGFQGKDYIDKVLNKSSIYLMTSETESFGIVLLEAMSHGVPCIAFDSAEGAREIISSGDNGYLIKNRNYVAMVKKIEDLIKNPKERKRVGLAGRSSIEKYKGDVVCDMWVNLIEEKD